MSRIRYLDGAGLRKFPKLRDSMFKDRAKQFLDRFKWPALRLDNMGWERDEYDFLETLYIIWELSDGTHGASIRLLPMNGPNMIHDHFSHLVPQHRFRSAEIWECSRFLVSDRASRFATNAVFVGAGELFRRNSVSMLLGLFDAKMLRLYRAMKNSPQVLSNYDSQTDKISVGAWQMSEPLWEESLKKIGADKEDSEKWYKLDFSKMASDRWYSEKRDATAA